MKAIGWALYPWFEEDGAALVHPDDLERFRALVPYGKVFARVGEEGEYVLLRCGDTTTRVRPGPITEVPPPPFTYGQRVFVRSKDSIGTVVEIGWHHAQGRPFFHVEIQGKRYSRRLWEEDLAARD